jgi:hypothetical protein
VNPFVKKDKVRTVEPESYSTIRVSTAQKFGKWLSELRFALLFISTSVVCKFLEGKKVLMQEFGDLCLMRAAEAGGN